MAALRERGPGGPRSDCRPDTRTLTRKHTRVSVYVDYENGLIVTRQNPTVSTEGVVAVEAPSVRAQQLPDGSVRVQYAAENALSPLPGAITPRVNGDVVFTPGSDGVSVDGVISDYPSLEVYQDNANGTRVVVIDPADSGNPTWGPATNLPFSHSVGDGSRAPAPFQDSVPIENNVLVIDGPTTTLTEGADPPRVAVVKSPHLTPGRETSEIQYSGSMLPSPHRWHFPFSLEFTSRR